MTTPSIFTKIISGEIPVHKVYEDAKTLAFLDINPLADGHVLIVPKIQVDEVWQLPDDYYQAIWQTARRLAKHMQKVLKPIRVASIVEGLGVPDHAHVHLIPLYDADVLHLHHGYPVDTSEENMKRLARELTLSPADS
jgi:histidine triad (HIT) family protein